MLYATLETIVLILSQKMNSCLFGNMHFIGAGFVFAEKRLKSGKNNLNFLEPLPI